MKKNKMMRLASVLLVLTLLSTSVISGTFAKYTTQAKSEDSARVAKWGINAGTTEMVLFSTSYKNVSDAVTVSANTSDNDNVIAPGTTGKSSYKVLTNTVDPEVKYTLTVDLTGSEINALVENNQNIQWRHNKKDANGNVTYGTWGTWDNMLNNAFLNYDTSNSSANFDTNKIYTKTIGAGTENAKIYTDLQNGGEIEWQWIFEDANAGKDGANSYKVTIDNKEVTMTQDEYDTYMGNQAATQDLLAKLVITITATQVD